MSSIASLIAATVRAIACCIAGSRII